MSDGRDDDESGDVRPSPVGRPVGAATRRGARGSLATQAFTQVGSVAATMILARLLTPAEFGIIALSQSLLGATTLLSMSGINAALVTRRDRVGLAASSYFWLTLVVALGMCAGFVLLSGPLTSALGQPEAAPYLAVLSLSFVFSTLALVPNALLQRQFRFGWLNGALAVSGAVYFATEIVLALRGWGAWAVIVGQVVGSVVALLVALAGARWRPSPTASLEILRSDIKVMTGLGLGHVLTYVQKNVDYWVVSRVIGGQALGIYYIAYVVPNIVRLRISAVLRQVMLPAFASATSREQAADMWVRSFPALAGLGIPALVGIALVAEPLVRVFFGTQWLDAIVPLQILTIATIADLIITSVGTLAIARRRMRGYVLVLGFRAATTVTFTIAAVAVWGSLSAVAMAVVLSAALTLIFQEFALSRPLGVGLGTVAAETAGYVGLTGLMAVVVGLAAAFLPAEAGSLVTLLTLSVIGAVTYFGFGWLIARSLIRPVLVDARSVLSGN